VVTVAGTNGKGSTAGLLEAMALAAGLRVGLYTSPHLVCYNERVKVNGVAASDLQLVEAFEAIEAVRDGVQLTYFEYGTLAALEVFTHCALDVLILEVGLGGRLDAVNIVDPDVAIITSISLDHQDWLGDDRESIGREKAGILRPGIHAVIADPDPPGSVLMLLDQMQCQVEYYSDDLARELPKSSLRKENIFAALAAARKLGFAPESGRLAAMLAEVVIPGRLQRLEFEGRSVVLDVAHNPDSVSNLILWLGENMQAPRVALFAALSDKDIHAMIRHCAGYFQHWVVTDLPGVSRARDARDLAAALVGAGEPVAAACGSIREAWAAARNLDPVASVVVFGSFYTVGGFMELLGEGR
jgi:dihydrofolate synthase/folylpolyglutamate synthase